MSTTILDAKEGHICFGQKLLGGAVPLISGYFDGFVDK